MEKSTGGTEKKKSRPPIATLSKYNNNKHIMVVYYKIWEKYLEIRLILKQNELEQSKNYPPSPDRKIDVRQRNRGRM